MKRSLESARDDFPALTAGKYDKPPVYMDNACTTLVPTQVIEALEQYYREFPACGGGRSRHRFAEEVNDRIEGKADKGIKGSRRAIQLFINARSPKEIIFTQNTSHAINMVALGLRFRPHNTVLLTDKEHNSNLLPWLRLERLGQIRVQQLQPTPDGSLDLDLLEKTVKKGNIGLISMAYTSNATGYTIPAKEVVKIAHDHGIPVLLDAAQAAPHRPIDVQDLGVDFLAFSLHKMCGPRGVGVLYGESSRLGQSPHEEESCDILNPAGLGGGTVSDTTYSSYDLLRPPERFEVGIQVYAGQIASGKAVEYLQQIGMERIRSYVESLNEYLTRRLLERYGEIGWFRIIGPSQAKERGGILTFEVRRPNAVGIAEDLAAKSNVMIRDGVFCVHSYFNEEFGQGWLSPKLPSEHRMIYRASVYFYNTILECDVFLDALNDVFRERSYI